jgi:glyoxylase-like metal-dependent hydrolase (beta-lactamase superfamily II)
MDPVRELVAARPDFFANRSAWLDRAVALNDFIYMSNGLSNAYMLTTADAGRVIINTGMGFEAPTHKRVFDAVHPGPTPYILLTQGHVDHVGGVRLFREDGTWLVAQRQNHACQADDARIRGVRSRQAYIWFKAAFDAAARALAERPALATQDVPVPDIHFDDRLNLRVGELELELHATPGGETVDSCVVWLPQHAILFCGNVFGPLFPHFPNFNTIRGDKYRFVEPYLDSLRRIRSLEPELLITGHFDPIKGRSLIRACLDRLEAAVDFVHRETLARINAGQDIWTAMREVTLPPELYVGQGYGKVSWAVRTIWESYMGWFKAAHTSELYPDVSHDAYRDLVGLAGAGAVVARGRERLEAGELECAMRLAEAALAHDRGELAALELARDTNRALLERSQARNFWETGWLRHEIDQLERRIAERRAGTAPA